MTCSLQTQQPHVHPPWPKCLGDLLESLSKLNLSLPSEERTRSNILSMQGSIFHMASE